MEEASEEQKAGDKVMILKNEQGLLNNLGSVRFDVLTLSLLWLDVIRSGLHPVLHYKSNNCYSNKSNGKLLLMETLSLENKYPLKLYYYNIKQQEQ